jgi:hypothetical protein
MLLIVVMRVGTGNLVHIFQSGLNFTSVAFLTEGEVQVIAHHTNPVFCFVLDVGFGMLGVDLLNWS